MAANNEFLERLTPDMLEGVAGGLTPDVESQLRAGIAEEKASGTSKNLIILVLSNDDEYRAELSAAGIDPDEVIAFVNAHWDEI